MLFEPDCRRQLAAHQHHCPNAERAPLAMSDKGGRWICDDEPSEQVEGAPGPRCFGKGTLDRPT